MTSFSQVSCQLGSKANAQRQRGSIAQERKNTEMINNDSSIQLHSLLKQVGIHMTIDILREKRQRLVSSMTATSRYFFERGDQLSLVKMDAYQRMNEELREIKIMEAELTFIKNLL
jgi:hypothetical protein